MGGWSASSRININQEGQKSGANGRQIELAEVRAQKKITYNLRTAIECIEQRAEGRAARPATSFLGPSARKPIQLERVAGTYELALVL